MIAIPIGLLVVFAVLRIFTANINGVSMQNGLARVQENGRIATDLLARDIRSADYWGCMNNANSIINNLDTTDSDYKGYILDLMPAAGVGGADNVSSTTVYGTSVVDGTDTLTLHGSQTFSEITIVSPYMVGSSAIVHASSTGNVKKGDILLLTDCQHADLFSVKTVTNSNSAKKYTFGYNTGNNSVAGAVNNATKIANVYEGSAQILSPYVKTYFISVNTSGGNSLYRSVNGNTSELVRGINDLQIMYGEDTTGNGSADTYSNATGVSDMSNVITIRISLTSSSSSDQSVKRLQRTYTVTSNIRNRTL